jgi:hypothetical protein
VKSELKKLWIEALLSGKYKQGRSRLATPTETGIHYCCLGVLCEVAGIPSQIHRGRITYDGEHAVISDARAAEFGMTKDQRARLIDLNDTGSSFPAIADYIQAHL